MSFPHKLRASHFLCTAALHPVFGLLSFELPPLQEEERSTFADPTKPVFHLCIVNLVIGTLYCAKGNFEFGISRIVKSLEPYDKKLGTDTW